MSLITGTRILEGMGVGKLLVTEGFGIAGTSFVPILIKFTDDPFEIISALNPLIPRDELVEYLNGGTLLIDVSGLSVIQAGVVRVDQLGIAEVKFVHEIPIETVLGLSASQLWSMLTVEQPVIVYSGLMFTPQSALHTIIESPAIAQADGVIVPTLVSGEFSS